jgi:hypothetical protein
MMMNETFKTYLFSYEHAGSTWVQEIKASSPQDAQARVRKLHAATLDGEMVAKLTMPAVSWRSAALKARRLILGR